MPQLEISYDERIVVETNIDWFLRYLLVVGRLWTGAGIGYI